MEIKLKNQDNIIHSMRYNIFSDIPNSVEYKLGDISDIIKGKQLNKEDMDDKLHYYVLNGGKSPSGYTDKWNVKENTITISEGRESCGYLNNNTKILLWRSLLLFRTKRGNE